jgi:hypothetical protein
VEERRLRVGDRVRTNAQGHKYYSQNPGDARINIEGVIQDIAGHTVGIRGYRLYENCVELVPAGPSEDEVAAAIESIANTPRRGK